jgi:hypothetical protein
MIYYCLSPVGRVLFSKICQWCISIKNGGVVWFRRGTEWGCAQCGDYKTIRTMADGQHAVFEYGVTQKSCGGRVLMKFSTLIQKLPNADIYAFAEKEFAMMQDFAERTADDPALAEFHQQYADGSKEWE